MRIRSPSIGWHWRLTSIRIIRQVRLGGSKKRKSEKRHGDNQMWNWNNGTRKWQKQKRNEVWSRNHQTPNDWTGRSNSWWMSIVVKCHGWWMSIVVNFDENFGHHNRGILLSVVQKANSPKIKLESKRKPTTEPRRKRTGQVARDKPALKASWWRGRPVGFRKEKLQPPHEHPFCCVSIRAPYMPKREEAAVDLRSQEEHLENKVLFQP